MSSPRIDNKFSLVLGGFLGFLATFLVGFFADKEIMITTRNAAIGSVIGAILVRFLFNIIERSFYASRHERIQKDQASTDNERDVAAALPNKK